MEIGDICAEYLRNVNPLAQRIAEDIDGVKDVYKATWDKLSSEEREHIVDDTLIQPELVVKYSKDAKENQSQYENISTFSWFTKSQLDLFSFINTKGNHKKSPLKRQEVFSLARLKDTVDSEQSVPTKLKSKLVKSPSSEERVTEIKIGSVKLNPPKPKTPPPPPPARLVTAENTSLLSEPNQDDIPKTGFDFLDNW